MEWEYMEDWWLSAERIMGADCGSGFLTARPLFVTWGTWGGWWFMLGLGMGRGACSFMWFWLSRRF